MHQATITYRSPIGGEGTVVVTSDDLNIFHAKIVGAVQGLTYGAGGSVVTSITTEKVDA